MLGAGTKIKFFVFVFLLSFNWLLIANATPSLCLIEPGSHVELAIPFTVSCVGLVYS